MCHIFRCFGTTSWLWIAATGQNVFSFSVHIMVRISWSEYFWDHGMEYLSSTRTSSSSSTSRTSPWKVCLLWGSEHWRWSVRQDIPAMVNSNFLRYLTRKVTSATNGAWKWKILEQVFHRFDPLRALSIPPFPLQENEVQENHHTAEARIHFGRQDL